MYINLTRSFCLSSFSNALGRASYRFAHRLWNLYITLTERETFGAQVALRCEQKILLVKSSYRQTYSFPGGYLDKGESAVDCASRELREEVGINIPASVLKPSLKHHTQFSGRMGHDEVFEYRVDRVMDVSIDHREIIFAEFIDMSDALELSLDSQVRKYILLDINKNKVRE